VIDVGNHTNSVKFTLVSYYAMQPPGITQMLRVKGFPLCEVYISQLLCNATTWDNTDAKGERFPTLWSLH